MLFNKAEHSPTLSSSQANKRRLHTHAKPSSSHPNLDIPSTVLSLQTKSQILKDKICKLLQASSSVYVCTCF